MKIIIQLLFVAGVVLTFTSSCCKDDFLINKEDEIIYVHPLWSYSLHKGGHVYSNSIVEENLVFDQGMLIATTEGMDDRWLTMVDFNGHEVWKWNDIYQPPTEKMDIQYFYTFDDLFAYQVGSRSYCINLKTGESHWRIRRDVSYDSELWGLGGGQKALV